MDTENTNIPYIGIVEGKRIDHPNLLIEGHSRMKIMLIDPDKDIPLKEINKILKQVIGFIKTAPLRLSNGHYYCSFTHSFSRSLKCVSFSL